MPAENSKLPSLELLLASGIIIVFIALKINCLNLPFYWDEGWSYATAIYDIKAHTISLFPGDVNPDLTRGHPLLFYFLSASWIRLLGTGLVITHIFPMLISCLFLVAIYFVSLDFFGKFTAVASMALLILQPEFFVQSTMLLPEIMLALWTLLTIYAYFKKKWIYFSIFSILLVLTKETGMVLIGALFFDKIVLERFFQPEKTKHTYTKAREIIILAIPALIFITFLIIQKIRLGYFLYPEHVGMMVDNPHEILIKFRKVFTKLFLHSGREILFVGLLISLVYLFVHKNVTKKAAHHLLFFLVFILVFVVFHSINFFTPRYVISVIPLFIMAGIWSITQSVGKRIGIVLIFGFALFSSYHIIYKDISEGDSSMGFRNSVLLQKQAVNFVEIENWQHEPIYTTFLMQYYMTHPELGYLNDPSNPFTQVSSQNGTNYRLYIFCSNEKDPRYHEIKKTAGIRLVKRFQNKKIWVEIFENTAF